MLIFLRFQLYSFLHYFKKNILNLKMASIYRLTLNTAPRLGFRKSSSATTSITSLLGITNTTLTKNTATFTTNQYTIIASSNNQNTLPKSITTKKSTDDATVGFHTSATTAAGNNNFVVFFTVYRF